MDSEDTLYTYDDYKNTSSDFWRDPMFNYNSFPKTARHRRKSYNYSANDQRTRAIEHDFQDGTFVPKEKLRTNIIQYPILKGLHVRYISHAKLNGKDKTRTSSTVAEAHKKRLPIYVRVAGKTVLLLSIRTTNYKDTKDDICNLLGINGGDVMLNFYGKLLGISSNRHIQPHDTIEIIWKNRGGMLGQCGEISKYSEVHEVMDWLKSRLGLSDGEVDKFSSFKYFDGNSVFMYDKTEYKELESDLQIPIGLARKILILRNMEHIDEIRVQSPMWKFNSNELGNFIRDTLKTNDRHIQNICQLIVEKYIDGVVFLMYTNLKEMQLDIHNEPESGIVYRKVFVRRDKILAGDSETMDEFERFLSELNKSRSALGLESLDKQKQHSLDRSHFIPIKESMSNAVNVQECVSVCMEDQSSQNIQSMFGNLEREKTSSALGKENTFKDVKESSLDNFTNNKIDDKKHSTGYSASVIDVDVESELDSITVSSKCFSKNIRLLTPPADAKKSVNKNGNLSQATHIGNFATTVNSSITLKTEFEEPHSTKCKKASDLQMHIFADENAPLHLFIENTLHLYPILSAPGNIVDCTLRTMHCNWAKPNLLEEKLLFIVLTDVEALEAPNAQKFLWQRIRKNMHNWFDHLNDSDRKSFAKDSRNDENIIIAGKPLSLPSSPLKMRYMKEKTVVELSKFSKIFLLVDKNVLQNNADGYCTSLVHPEVKRKSFYNFGFDASQRYWLFDPSDFAYGFQLQQIKNNCCGKIQHQSCNEFNEKLMLGENEYSLMPTESEDEKTSKAESADDDPLINVQRCRNFKDHDSAVQYHEKWILSTPEHDGAVSYRCFEYKFITNTVVKKGAHFVSRFIEQETLRFACGCLNARKNGTIIFGIGDNQNKEHLHGEIVGFHCVGSERDFRVQIIESLRSAITACFEDSQKKIALKCIGNLVFVEVIPVRQGKRKFVIECDVEPSSNFCKNICFKINRSLIADFSNQKKIEKTFTCYVRENTSTVSKTKSDLELFLCTELDSIIKNREDEEKQRMSPSVENPELPMDILRKRLCNGLDTFDKSVWPFLIINKPTDSQKQDDYWFRSFKFIKHFNFNAIFDFDDKSNVDGMSRFIRNEEKSILLDEEIFQEYTGRKNDLALKLNIPQDMKSVWIFSNGRSDLQPPKPHVNETEWTDVYSAGIRDAVIFYAQKDIIPKGRAVIIILLLSSEFDGVTETFREIVVRFGWNQILIITTDDVLERFIHTFREMEDKIRKCSIYGKGVTWEHVNATFLEIAGLEDEGTVHIITSSGISVPAEEKFVETLNDIHILSSKQCENKKFKNKEERSKFAIKKERQFYKGNKVEWFNFYFQDQVLKRHCFDRLKKNIGSILQAQQIEGRQNKIISTVIISHEPGAGGTTLARHLLWEFRAHYRCAIIKKITERTAINILALWQHKETKILRPLLLLIDDLQFSEYSFEDLRRQLYIEYRSHFSQEGLVCCFLLCQREEQIDTRFPAHLQAMNNVGDVIEPLKQHLTKDEVEWMHEKSEKMESTQSDYQHQYLISFMILREGFNQDYITNTIKRFLSKLDINSNEFELLEYTSLLSTYVPTSRRGPSAFIPLECCDDLMGLRTIKTVSWEKTMSSVLKIFLIVEPKDTASGMQIRMAHPALAEAVLKEILENKKRSLGELTLRFLDSSIIQSQTHARGMIIDFTKEMLKRRLKEEYNDSKTTLFSPLVEEICKQERWSVAVDVLKKGLDKFNDGYIAQTLARLCVKYKDFDNAETWARQAIEMSFNNKTACSYSHYTLATVLEDKFKHKTNSKTMYPVSPTAAMEYISLILEALDHFQAASYLKVGSEDHLLYPIKGVLTTIVNCVKFIRNYVVLSKDVEVKKIFTTQEYCPDEIGMWEKFRPSFLNFIQQGEEAFSKIEECLCFFTTFYAHESIGSCTRKSREHRLYRNLQYKYPELFNDFRDFFGASPEECPVSQIPEVVNGWHRRRLLHLGGNNYMNICNIFRELRKKNNFTALDAKERCVKIKYHLMKITERNAKDLANLVSVNFVLGLLGGRNRDSTDKILDYCKQIIKMKRGFEDVAYFFVSILLWPSNKIDVPYDDDLFYDSLKYLNRDREIKQGRPRITNYTVMKEEKNITQATTQFFLSKGTGFKSICHRLDIFFREEPESEFDNTDTIQKMKNNLKQLSGQLKISKGKCHIRMKNDKSNDDDRCIQIRNIRSYRKEFISEEDVYFYLGFSIAGPIAYNVQPIRYETDHESIEPMHYQEKVEEYLHKTEGDLHKLLATIDDLKSKRRNGRNISARDAELMKDEDDIQTALDVKLDSNNSLSPL